MFYASPCCNDHFRSLNFGSFPWVRVDGDEAEIGITDHAQEALGEITYVELPPIGKEVDQFAELAVVESAKAASDIYSPLSGTVSEINSHLDGSPAIINQSPYEEGWICRLTDVSAAEVEKLLSADEYAKLLESES